jgi:agmatinase
MRRALDISDAAHDVRFGRRSMLDPCSRWLPGGEKPEYAGLLTFCELPYTEDEADLAGVDVAIVGAPMDELVSDRAGARAGPRAIRSASGFPGAHLETGINPYAELRVVDFGDAPVLPADPARSHAAIEHTVGAVVRAGAIPLILGGDHSIAEPDIRACTAVHGPVGLVHFDAHTDSAPECLGAEFSHGTPMYRLVESGAVDPLRYVQIGLRGYWPAPSVFDWQRERGITSLFMHEVRERGIADVLEEAIAIMGDDAVFVSVDIDVLDPAFAPGTGTPEPGGMSSGELLWACRTAGERLRVIGADVAEVSPTWVGSSDITALVASRIVHELLAGIAARERPQMPSRLPGTRHQNLISSKAYSGGYVGTGSRGGTDGTPLR